MRKGKSKKAKVKRLARVMRFTHLKRLVIVWLAYKRFPYTDPMIRDWGRVERRSRRAWTKAMAAMDLFYQTLILFNKAASGCKNAMADFNEAISRVESEGLL